VVKKNSRTNTNPAKHAPRPNYRTYGVGFSTNGFQLEEQFYGNYTFKAYYDSNSGRFSGVGLLDYNGNKLEVSVNGLGKNRARQKVIRAITAADYEATTKHYEIHQKRSGHKARSKSRKKHTLQQRREYTISLRNW